MPKKMETIYFTASDVINANSIMVGVPKGSVVVKRVSYLVAHCLKILNSRTLYITMAIAITSYIHQKLYD